MFFEKVFLLESSPPLFFFAVFKAACWPPLSSPWAVLGPRGALWAKQRATGKKKKHVLDGVLCGGPCRTRTYNPLIKSQLLYQLS